MSKKRQRWKIYRDEVKERLTNHWDMDYMSAELIAAEYAKPKLSDDGAAEGPTVRPCLVERIRRLILGS